MNRKSKIKARMIHRLEDLRPIASENAPSQDSTYRDVLQRRDYLFNEKGGAASEDEPQPSLTLTSIYKASDYLLDRDSPGQIKLESKYISNPSSEAKKSNRTPRTTSHSGRKYSLNEQLAKAGIDGPSKMFDADLEQSYQEYERIKMARKSYSKRVPLTFMKPYAKFKTETRALEEVKSKLYKSIVRPSFIPDLNTPPRRIIQYYTEYGEQQQQQQFQSNRPQSVAYLKRQGLMPACVARNKIRSQEKKSDYLERMKHNDVNSSKICYINNFLKLCTSY